MLRSISDIYLEEKVSFNISYFSGNEIYKKENISMLNDFTKALKKTIRLTNLEIEVIGHSRLDFICLSYICEALKYNKTINTLRIYGDGRDFIEKKLFSKHFFLS